MDKPVSILKKKNTLLYSVESFKLSTRAVTFEQVMKKKTIKLCG
jgi:hypothetical protein